MKVFFGGIIQGSCQGSNITSQDYREKIKAIFHEKYPDFEIIDPFASHSNSIEYDDDQAKETFFMHLDIVDSSDLMIAFLPQASMGTAIEMYRALHCQVPVITISPMSTNWVIRLFSIKNFETIESFAKFIQEDNLMKLLSDNKKASEKIEESA
ncbi:MAG: hypothetical protein J7K40_04085 [candidate division Zixibacteria bacterium]|nr:hypothetical protein [candidate division Zixibacteria bacterium]